MYIYTVFLLHIYFFPARQRYSELAREQQSSDIRPRQNDQIKLEIKHTLAFSDRRRNLCRMEMGIFPSTRFFFFLLLLRRLRLCGSARSGIHILYNEYNRSETNIRLY